MIKTNFTLRVLVVSFLFLALPLLIDSFIFFQKSYFDSISDAKMALRTEASYRAFNLLNLEPVRETLLNEFIYILDLGNKIENPDQAQLNRALSEIVHEGGAFHLYIMKIDGPRYKVIASSNPLEINNYFVSYQLLPDVLKKGGGTFIRYDYSNEHHRLIPYIFMVREIYSPKTGEPIGFLMVTADVSKQLEVLTQQTALQENVLFAVLNKDGIVFAATDHRLLGQYFDPISAERRDEILKSGQIGLRQLAPTPLPVIQTKDYPFFEFVYNDQVQIAYRIQAPIGWISLVSYSPKEAFFGKAIRHFLLIYVLYGLILVLGAGVTYWLSSYISSPLRQLTHLMTQVSKGKLDARFKEERFGFEINILGSLFNQTLDNLLENIQKAEDERVKKETYQKELSIVRQVQRSILPSEMPELKGADISGIYVPTKDVGGDHYGYMKKQLKNGREGLLIAVVDAAGRGISSSLYAHALRALFRTYATLSEDVGEILSQTNNTFVQDAGDTGMFIQVLLGLYEEETKKFNYFSCGHVSGLLKRANGNVMSLVSSGIAIGLKEVEKYATEELQLASGDILILYTAGALQARNENGEPFTEERLKAAVLSEEWESAQSAVDGIMSALNAFIHSREQEDEIILVALKVY